MGIEGVRETTFKKIFIEYLISIITSILGLSIVVWGLVYVLIQVGVVLPANYEERQVLEYKKVLQGKEVLTPQDFEQQFSYALFDMEDNLIDTNLEEISDAVKQLNGEDISGKDYYMRIDGANQVAFIVYQLRATYQHPLLEAYLPPIEVLGIGIVIVGIILLILILSSIYATRIKKALQPLEDAARAIEVQNLNFEIKPSRIKEVNQVGNSLTHMKEALQQSLILQWQVEEEKRAQMAALAHDIKTPLTIIRGSAELIHEECLDEETQELSQSIVDNSQQIQMYIKMLIEISKQQEERQLDRQLTTLSVFTKDLYKQACQLAALQSVQVEMDIQDEDRQISIDSKQLSRALLNVISNAVDYTPAGKQVVVAIENDNEWVKIQVTDSGKGFSIEGMKLAKQAFYMEDSSRNKKGHYGMGLYIADQIVTRHGGRMEINNQLTNGGGQVAIYLPQ